MVFSTLTFLYFFFPICLILYFAMPNLRAKNYVLMGMSLLFYAWGEPLCIFLMMLTAFVNYLAGRQIAKAADQKAKKRWLVFSVAVSLAFLVFFKYTNFLLENLSLIPGIRLPGFEIALPIGISFYTFQALSYAIDVYRNQAKVQHSYADFLLYVSLFPQLIAGPIVRYVDVQNEITSRRTTAEGFVIGITRFVVGLGKKLLLANYCGASVDKLLAVGTDTSVLGGWLGLVLYAFQIYFDFSGYSDMAIGLGRMFGFKFLENFNYPYICDSITDFWRRWHISLSTWFRDYVYIPLGGNRRGKGRQVLNLLVVWFLTGFWHGASWNFILWGLYFAVLLMLEKFVFAGLMQKMPRVLRHISALFFVLMGWALFYFEDLGALGAFFARLFGSGAGTSDLALTLLENNSLLLIVCAIASTPLGKLVRSIHLALIHAGGALRHISMALRLLFNTVVMTICTIVMVTNTYNPFMYFRF
ncbi:MAG: MBOAT family protein [Ruminococcaceae bacterium]|nr:MBOAT family protein [Oscillospiraceae bacterium]